MAQVYVKYNPYRLETILKVDGREISPDSNLYKVTKGKRLQEWIGSFPQMLRDELNTVDFSMEFCGMSLDWDDFEESFRQAQESGIINISDLRFTAGKSDNDINQKIVNVFQDLQEGPLDDFRNPKLVKAFENANNSIFPVNVVATMSSGKSTLINALLGTPLMPSKNEACTATITEILDVDSPDFSAKVYDEDNNKIQDVPHLTLEIMNELNSDENVHLVFAEGNIPFLPSDDTALKLVDTPGPNNAQNQAHKNTTFKAINNDANNLILYVLNGTQLGTNDDSELLHYVADQMQKGGKQVRDRFLFVINKMDQFNPEAESIENAIQSARNYLARYGIEDPQLFPCSAYTALNIRTYLSDVDISKLSIFDMDDLPLAAAETITASRKFLRYKSMHLEKYTTLSPSAQKELNFRLSKAIENNDLNEQLLIHSGICSIEAAITAYVKKYAKTKKIKDLVESFQEVLESNNVLANAENLVMTNAAAAKECQTRAAAIRKKLADGKEAAVFKQKIDSLNPMAKIQAGERRFRGDFEREVNKIFRPYGDIITNENEAKRLVSHFTTFCSDKAAAFAAEMESLINTEIMGTSEQILLEYQKKVSRLDESSEGQNLDFKTMDLIKGALKTMREQVDSYSSDKFAADTADAEGQKTTRHEEYYEKVGEKVEEVVAGYHQEKVGTEKVKVGSHREKVGTRSTAKWWNPFSWFSTEDVYKNVDDYEDRDVFETVTDYKKVKRDVFEKRTRNIHEYKLNVNKLQNKLMTKINMSFDASIKDIDDRTVEQIKQMKEQFNSMFDKLDAIIKETYQRLEECGRDQKEKENNLKKNQEILRWIKTNMDEIDSVLDM